MIVLGIESTSHTFGIGIVDDKKIIANEKSVYIPKKDSGIIPRDAAEHHSSVAMEVLSKSLGKIDIKDVDAIAFSEGPGLPQCLRVGAVFARALSLKLKKPLIPVNHCIAHIEIGKLTTKSKDPVVLYLSGGNTQVIAFTEGRYRVFGETQDIPIGNALDVLARGLELDLSAIPGGLAIENLAKKGKYIELPYVVKGMDLSFAGLATEAVRRYNKGVMPEDIAYSFQETCFAMLTEVTERAVAHTDKEEVMLVGGVAANKRMQEMIRIMADERGAKVFIVPFEYAGDCGANIAWNGLLECKYGKSATIKESQIRQRWRVEEV
ncbi:MAG: KEOPS complex N(6)-L-threonylcarbamoyladenine synthase Kae1, partial [Candidatus Aenigmatarchaeota archaeon]